jgi:hypothetical protein
MLIPTYGKPRLHVAARFNPPTHVWQSIHLDVVYVHHTIQLIQRRIKDTCRAWNGTPTFTYPDSVSLRAIIWGYHVIFESTSRTGPPPFDYFLKVTQRLDPHLFEYFLKAPQGLDPNLFNI